MAKCQTIIDSWISICCLTDSCYAITDLLECSGVRKKKHQYDKVILIWKDYTTATGSLRFCDILSIISMRLRMNWLVANIKHTVNICVACGLSNVTWIVDD